MDYKKHFDFKHETTNPKPYVTMSGLVSNVATFFNSYLF